MEEDLVTGAPVASDETVEEVKSIVINVAKEGGIKVDFNGNLTTHEVFGALVVTMMDLGVQNFINPSLMSVMNGVKESENNVLKALGPDVNKAAEPSQLVKDIQSLVENARV